MIRKIKKNLRKIGRFIKLFNAKSDVRVNMLKVMPGASLMEKLRVARAYAKYRWMPEEYYFFNYRLLSKEGIHSFVAEREGTDFRYRVNSRQVRNILKDKGEAYKIFKSFYKREQMSIKPKDDVEKLRAEFVAFATAHPRFIVKATRESLGRGIEILDTKDYKSVEDLFLYILANFNRYCVIEELIQQVPEMGKFHPGSVNTVRLATVRFTDGSVYLIHRSFMRMGKGGRCVDNAGQGGIVAFIDFETGVVSAVMDEAMNTYIVHPDTQEQIIGFKIPLWEEAKEMALQLAEQLPECKYCGWDLALTDKGWVMVEGNDNGFFVCFQLPNQKGFREEFEHIKKMTNFR